MQVLLLTTDLFISEFQPIISDNQTLHLQLYNPHTDKYYPT